MGIYQAVSRNVCVLRCLLFAVSRLLAGQLQTDDARESHQWWYSRDQSSLPFFGFLIVYRFFRGNIEEALFSHLIEVWRHQVVLSEMLMTNPWNQGQLFALRQGDIWWVSFLLRLGLAVWMEVPEGTAGTVIKVPHPKAKGTLDFIMGSALLSCNSL